MLGHYQMNTLLADITSGDATRVWSSSCAIIKLRDSVELDDLASHLPLISMKTKVVELGGALFPNSEHLKFTLRKLEYHRARSGCMCRLYPEYLLFNPEDEEKAGHIQIIAVTYIDERWVDAYTCRFTECGAAYRVEEREYHYTWWDWQPLAQPGVEPDGFTCCGPAD